MQMSSNIFETIKIFRFYVIILAIRYRIFIQLTKGTVQHWPLKTLEKD